MRLVSPALWSLVGLLACLAPVNAAGVVEINVVFPQQNETYAPTDYFPIVFALQNVEMAKYLDASIHSFIWNDSRLDAFGSITHDLTKANGSSEPYFAYRYENIIKEGSYHVFTRAMWANCNVTDNEVSIHGSTSNFGVSFNIKKGAQEVDLVTATTKDRSCYGQHGVSLNVTDQIHDVPEPPKFGDFDPLNPPLSGTCAVLASSPTTTTNPCGITIDSAAAASMSAALHSARCEWGQNPPADCPEENAVQQLAVAGIACFAAALGAIGFLLA